MIRVTVGVTREETLRELDRISRPCEEKSVLLRVRESGG